MRTLILLVVLVAAAVPARAQSAADSAAIRQAALDYIEGWYAADTVRMQRALHPELAKRIVLPDDSGRRSFVRDMTASELITQTRRGGGRGTPAQRQRKDVRILDVYGNAASVRVTAADWIDYMHLARSDGRWVIINVLWEREPRPAS